MRWWGKILKINKRPPSCIKHLRVYSKCVPQQKLLLEFIGNLSIKSLTCFKHQINITVVLLSCGSFFKYWSVFWMNGVLKCSTLTVHLEVTLGMIFVVLYKYLNCTADKLLMQVTLLLLTVTINYWIIILMMLFITSWSKPWSGP